MVMVNSVKMSSMHSLMLAHKNTIYIHTQILHYTHTHTHILSHHIFKPANKQTAYTHFQPGGGEMMSVKAKDANLKFLHVFVLFVGKIWWNKCDQSWGERERGTGGMEEKHYKMEHLIGCTEKHHTNIIKKTKNKMCLRFKKKSFCK